MKPTKGSSFPIWHEYDIGFILLQKRAKSTTGTKGRQIVTYPLIKSAALRLVQLENTCFSLVSFTFIEVHIKYSIKLINQNGFNYALSERLFLHHTVSLLGECFSFCGIWGDYQLLWELGITLFSQVFFTFIQAHMKYSYLPIKSTSSTLKMVSII